MSTEVKARISRRKVLGTGKPIPRRAALNEAMFKAELKNLIATAGHDLARPSRCRCGWM
jgi:hypothetical protein